MSTMTRQPTVPGPSKAWPGTSALELEDLLEEFRSRVSAARRSQERLGSLLDAVVAVSADLELSEVLGRIVAVRLLAGRRPVRRPRRPGARG